MAIVKTTSTMDGTSLKASLEEPDVGKDVQSAAAIRAVSTLSRSSRDRRNMAGKSSTATIRLTACRARKSLSVKILRSFAAPM